ncbi:MAG: polysaccharide ABC transporter ATP-binding protein [Cytophagales bacterium]
MSDLAIKVENVSKVYRLGEVGTGTLSHDLNRYWAKVRGKEDPYTKVAEVNDRTTSSDSKYVWALKDISLDIKQGEVLGIIGKNGAGKSTLLKLLSKVTAPTKGVIKTRGRISSLLEVGTGFHPEMTGRENIFMNGTINGMSRKEISSKLDHIVSFAGVDKYVDTPTKRYSSGMTVRLGFAVAAFLEPEVMIIDEVLAVGDAEFQSKAINKVKELSEKKGKTIIFVSHNLRSVRALCNRAILLDKGTITIGGVVEDVIDSYLTPKINNSTSHDISSLITKCPKNDQFELLSIDITQGGRHVSKFDSGQSIELHITYRVFQPIHGLRVYFDINDHLGDLLIRSFHDEKDQSLVSRISPGLYESKASIPGNILAPNKHILTVRASIFNGKAFIPEGINLPIDVQLNQDIIRSYPSDVIRSKILPDINWETNVS